MTDQKDPNASKDTGPESPVTTRRGIRSFVLRQGRMTEGQKKAYERSWPVYGLTREHGMIDPREVFGREAMLNLEIGFGMGKSLADMAEASRDVQRLVVNGAGSSTFFEVSGADFELDLKKRKIRIELDLDDVL